MNSTQARRDAQEVRAVSSTQTDLHADLPMLVQRYQQAGWAQWHAPMAEHTQAVFAEINAWQRQQGKPLILDSGCGVGQSTAWLAERFPDCSVIGVDRSADRLSRQPILPGNAMIVRAELTDFWRLAVQHQWSLARHYWLYPNPYPKPKHVQRRWHAHPVFPAIMQLGGRIECRSNWLVYLKELQWALQRYGRTDECNRLNPLDADEQEAVTLFERKYLANGHVCWQLVSEA